MKQTLENPVFLSRRSGSNRNGSPESKTKGFETMNLKSLFASVCGCLSLLLLLLASSACGSTDPKPETVSHPYEELLAQYAQALYEHQTSPETWRPEPYMTEQQLVSAVIDPYWAREDPEGLLEQVGYALLDLNGDGVDELVLGWLDNEFWNLEDGCIFALYTVVDGSVVLAAEGWDRCQYVLGTDGYLYSRQPGGAMDQNFLKYAFGSGEDPFLKPVEELYSRGTASGMVSQKARWEYLMDPEKIGVIEDSGPHEDLEISEEQAEDMIKVWMEFGAAIQGVRFAQYRIS